MWHGGGFFFSLEYMFSVIYLSTLLAKSATESENKKIATKKKNRKKEKKDKKMHTHTHALTHQVRELTLPTTSDWKESVSVKRGFGVEDVRVRLIGILLQRRSTEHTWHGLYSWLDFGAWCLGLVTHAHTLRKGRIHIGHDSKHSADRQTSVCFRILH